MPDKSVVSNVDVKQIAEEGLYGINLERMQAVLNKGFDS